MRSEVIATCESHVLTITWNRPEVLNAWTPAMERTYLALLADADQDDNIRAIIVTGAGRGFCAGADLSRSAVGRAAAPAPLPPRDRGTYPPTMSVPVIAAVNGACAGVGLAMALQADIRFVAEDAKLTTAFTRRGLIAEHGAAWHLERLVGRGRALDLLLTARMFSGREAYTYGLAEFCLPADQVLAQATAYAHTLASDCSPRAMAKVKQQLYDDPQHPAFEALLRADHATRESFTWPDLIEGISAWQEKRPPRFPSFSLDRA